MKQELEKVYDPSQVEDRLYQQWIQEGYFEGKADSSKKPYTIVMPPPNITGQLHMGHALDSTLQDILIRFKRMQGYNALWIPGIDHASISTEVKIVQKMAEEGLTKEEIGRNAFLDRAWEWKEEYGGKILNQIQKLGSSCDWNRVRFTMDEGLSKAVKEVFLRLYEKGYIYQGEKLVNWCPHCKTTISDAEVNHNEFAGHFWHIRYPIVGEDGFLELATTRPETMLGDTAVAVHPDDVRYQRLVGKQVMLPLTDRAIPVIADAYVDPKFGTGVVKITPAHDPNDLEVGNRHGLERITVIDDDGTMNRNAGKYQGLDRYEARKRMVEELDQQGLLVRVEDITHAVGVHERCNTVVEPLLKRQWFVKMEEMAKPAMEAMQQGELRFVPERFGKIYMHWLENIHDWCISRQLWWGHRIPAWYCQDCGHVEVSREEVTQCPHCKGKNCKQDEDTLDTWFSSALWPFATLGWPDETEDLSYFYPTNVLVTGYDIIFFWVVRMVFSGLEHTKKLPFQDVLIHGLIRDEQGRKFSKSLGNGIDPLEAIAQYGADALRLTLVSGNAPGNDMRFYWDRLLSNRNFLNKLWNASRFVLMHEEEKLDVSIEELTIADQWILSKVNTVTQEVTRHLEQYDLGLAVEKAYNFVWDEYCDWYIEMVKPRLFQEEDPTRKAAQWTLQTVLKQALKLLHPFLPFITEEIFTHVQSEEKTIMQSAWPSYKKEWEFSESAQAIDWIKEAVRSIRAIRKDMNVPPSQLVHIYVVSPEETVRKAFAHSSLIFQSLARGKKIDVQEEKAGIGEDAVSAVISGAVLYLPLADLVDPVKEVERLQKEKEKVEQEIKRVESKLNNEGFLKKAPQNVVEEEQEKRKKYQVMAQQIEERLKQWEKMGN